MYNQVTEYLRQRVTVPDEALERAFGHSRIVRYKKGEYILRAGEYCGFVAFLNLGLIMVTLSDKVGKEIICKFFFEDEFFTYIESIKNNIPSHKNFIAMEDCEVLLLNKSELPLIFSIHPAFETFFNLCILDDLHRMMRYVQDSQTQSLEERYLNMMTTRATLFDRIPLKFIAGYLGVAPPSLSRLRKRLVKRREINRG
jgi:CRP/FNR family transcriptional regulator, anaerobic regulatory protein